MVSSIIVSNSPSDSFDDDLSNSDHEFTSGKYNSPSVGGRLSLCYDQWVKLGALGFVLSVVRDGYKIPFVAFLSS